MEDKNPLIKFECSDCEINFHMYLEDKDFASYCPNCRQANIKENENKIKLEIKDNGEILLKKIDEYNKKYPKITNIENESSTDELLKNLNEEVDFLTKALKNNHKKNKKKG